MKAESPGSMANRPTILITGASGFVGRHLARELSARHRPWLGVARRAHACTEDPVVSGVVQGPELGPVADWSPFLSGISTVVHCAARVHVMNESGPGAEAAYEQANVQGTVRLAEQAVAAGVRRFVFLSSIKVLGEATATGQAFHAQSPLAPQDAYGRSKAAAEQALLALGQKTGLQVVIIRPPLVYGPGVGGNFAQLLRAVQRGLPLPLGAVRNQRSLVGVGNLVDLIIHAMDHPAAAGQAWLVSDGQDLSTPELLQAVARATGRRLWLPPVPPSLLRLAGSLLGRQAAVDRLCGNLQVDISQTCSSLGWTPPFTVEQGMARAVGKASPGSEP